MPLAISLVSGAITAAVGTIAGEHTVAAIDNARNEIALAVGVGHALMVDGGLCLGAELRPYVVEHALKLAHLVEGERGTTVALNAALALAGVEVAAKAFG